MENSACWYVIVCHRVPKSFSRFLEKRGALPDTKPGVWTIPFKDTESRKGFVLDVQGKLTAGIVQLFPMRDSDFGNDSVLLCRGR